MAYTYKYPRPAVTADCVVITKEEQPKVLLIQRGADPSDDVPGTLSPYLKQLIEKWRCSWYLVTMASDISKYNKSWPHVTSSVSKVKRNQAARSNCSSSRRCHRSAHRGSTWFLLSHCKDRYFSVKSKLFLSISSFSAKFSLSLQVQCGNNWSP